jgi:hypothetical protein
MATAAWWRGQCWLAIGRGDVGAAVKGPASHSEPADLHRMAGDLPQRRSNVEEGGTADVMVARWRYGLRQRWLGRPATPLEGGDRGTTFLHEVELRREAQRGCHQ